MNECPNLPAAIDRIATEVGDSYPAFGLRGIDWAALCARYRPAVQVAPHPIDALQEWLAALHDTHTWVRPAAAMGELPYEVWLTAEAATLTQVPSHTAAWAAGVRPGWQLLGQDVPSW